MKHKEDIYWLWFVNLIVGLMKLSWLPKLITPIFPLPSIRFRRSMKALVCIWGGRGFSNIPEAHFPVAGQYGVGIGESIVAINVLNITMYNREQWFYAIVTWVSVFLVAYVILNTKFP